MEVEFGDFRENLNKGLLLYDDLGNFKRDNDCVFVPSEQVEYVPKKTFIRHSGLINIYAGNFFAENFKYLGPVTYTAQFIVGKKPSDWVLRILFGEVIRVDHFDKQGNKIKFKGNFYTIEEMREKEITPVFVIDEKKYKKELDSVIYLPETADIYDVLSDKHISKNRPMMGEENQGGLFKSKTDAKHNWKFSGKKIECGITELLYVGKYHDNIFIYKDYPDVEEDA